MWILLSILGAFSQAIEMAVKKKALQVKGLNNFIAFFSFTFAGIIIGFILFFQSEELFREVNNFPRFWHNVFWSVSLNVFSYFFLYKALDVADLSYLMPFMVLTSVFVIIPPFFLLGEIPSIIGFLGILTIVCGAILMEYKRKNKLEIRTEGEIQKIKNNRKGFVFFIITAACWTITPTTFKIAIVESSPLFASFIIVFFIGLSFSFLVILLNETSRIKEIFYFNKKEKIILLIALMIAGISIAIQQVSMNTALKLSDVSYVMAVKRTMPFFAFIIGYLYFKEREHAKRKLAATALMIAGAILIVLFN